MITTPTRKAELVSSIFAWSIWSFPCSLLPIDWCRISSNKNGFAKALFRGNFPSSSQVCCCADAWEEMVRPWTVWKKNHPDLVGVTDDGMLTFFAEFVCCLAFSGGSRTKCPTTTKRPGSPLAQGRLLPAHKLMRTTGSATSPARLVTFGLGWIWFGIVLSLHKQFARLRYDGRFYVLQPRNRLHSNLAWGRILVVWPSRVEGSISSAANLLFDRFSFKKESQIIGFTVVFFEWVFLSTESLTHSLYLSICLCTYLYVYINIIR